MPTDYQTHFDETRPDWHKAMIAANSFEHMPRPRHGAISGPIGSAIADVPLQSKGQAKRHETGLEY